MIQHTRFQRQSPFVKVILIVIYITVSYNVCEGVYKEYKMMENCEEEIDLTNGSIIAGKLVLSSSSSQRNCTVILKGWFAWNRIAFEVTEYNLEDGACILIGQRQQYSWSYRNSKIDPLYHVCQQGPETEVTFNKSSTLASYNMYVALVPGVQGTSSFTLKFFGYSDGYECYGIACDDYDKCLSKVLMCKDHYLFGDCAKKTRCKATTKVKEEAAFQLSVSQILGIVSACLALPNLCYILYKCCRIKCSDSDDFPPDDPDMGGESMRLQVAEPVVSAPDEGPVPSAPDMPFNAAPPSYEEVMMDDQFKKQAD